MDLKLNHYYFVLCDDSRPSEPNHPEWKILYLDTKMLSKIVNQPNYKMFLGPIELPNIPEQFQ